MENPSESQNESAANVEIGNNSISLDSNQQMREMAESVGDFIRYWGFRRIHGQLWTQVYLSKKPLSGADMMRNLGVSKALVSPALGELVKYKLIHSHDADGRTKKYTANPQVFTVIRDILKERERNLILKAQKKFEELEKSNQSEGDAISAIDGERLASLGQMIMAARFALDVVLKSAEDEPLASWAMLAQAMTK